MRRIFIITLILIFIIIIYGCQGSVNKESIIIFGKPKDAVTLDPGDTDEGESTPIVWNIFDTLVRFKGNTVDIEPSLATNWKVSEDGTVWTFYLRKGVKFHDGTPFNAEAVKFNYDRQIDPKNPYRYQGHFAYWSLFFNKVKKIETVDEYTVVFKLSQKDPTFLSNLALFNMGIISPTAIKKYKEEIFKNPVGTGPFKFVSWVKDEKIVVEANNEYWDTPPKINKIIYKPIPDNSVRLLELEKGSVNLIDGINPDDVPRIKKNKDLKLLNDLGMNIGYMAINNEKPPFNKLKVRLAIAHAINKDVKVRAFFLNGELGIKAKNPLPPNMWSYNDEIQDYEYNPEKAKKLLKEAGFSNGFETTLWVMPMSRPYMPNPTRIAESIQEDLKIVGIKTKIITHEWGTYLNKLANGEHDLALIGWIADTGDPDNFLYTMLDVENTKKPKAANYSFYKGEEMHQLLKKAQSTMDQKEREKLYRKVQEIFHRDIPFIPLFHANQIMAARNNVNNFLPHPTAAKFFRTITLD